MKSKWKTKEELSKLKSKDALVNNPHWCRCWEYRLVDLWVTGSATNWQRADALSVFASYVYHIVIVTMEFSCFQAGFLCIHSSPAPVRGQRGLPGCFLTPLLLRYVVRPVTFTTETLTWQGTVSAWKSAPYRSDVSPTTPTAFSAFTRRPESNLFP